jgi:hypothetical protein
MAKKSEQTVRVAKSASLITEEIGRVLAKHGFKEHILTGFSIAPSSAESEAISVINCPSGYRREWTCRTVNGTTHCRWECIKVK